MIPSETATVYRGGRRRWFTAAAAARAEAAHQYRLRHPCECEKADKEYPGYECDLHGEKRNRFVIRVARLLLAKGKTK